MVYTASAQDLQESILAQIVVNAWRELRPDRVEPERLDLLTDEVGLTAVFRLPRVGKANSNVIAKRCKQSTALLERTLYEEILPKLPLPILHYYGCVKDPDGEFFWLFLEDMSGERYNPDILRHRIAAGRWIGIMNTSALAIGAARCLPERGPAHYLNLLQTARDTILLNFANPALNSDDLALLRDIIAHCDHLSAQWSLLARFCGDMPKTLVHGDFIEKNVGVRTSGDEIVIFPFDWEKAGWGIPAEDISRVDVTTYWLTVQEQWPRLSIDFIRQMANVGKIFRCLVFLDWLAPYLVYESVEQPMDDMRRCETWLADLIPAAEWNSYLAP